MSINSNELDPNSIPSSLWNNRKPLMFEQEIVENIVITKNQYMQITLQNSRKKRTISNDIRKNQFKYFTVLFTIGMLNQIGYNLTQNSAQNIADRFGYSQLISIFQTLMILMASWTILISSLYMIHVDYTARIQIVVSLQFLSLLITALANMSQHYYGFWLCSFSSALIGIAQGLGEASVIGFLQSFPPQMVGFYSSGTGMGGIAASLFYLLMQNLDVPDKYSYLIMVPINTIPYLFCFLWLVHKRNTCKSYASIIRNTKSLVIKSKLIINEKDSDQEQDVQHNKPLNLSTMFSVICKLKYQTFNCASVFFLEYIILACLLDRTNPKSKNIQSNYFFQKNAYVILNFMYQFGVFLSRSSLEYIKISKLEIMTICQTINLLVLFVNSYLQVISIELQILMYLWVGIMGGLSYVNTIYMIHNDNTIQQNEKELCSNIILIASDFSIGFAGVISMLLSTTLFRNNQ